MSKMYIDQVKAPIDNILASDRLDDPNNFDNRSAGKIYLLGTRVPVRRPALLQLSGKMYHETAGPQLDSSRTIQTNMGCN